MQIDIQVTLWQRIIVSDDRDPQEIAASLKESPLGNDLFERYPEAELETIQDSESVPLGYPDGVWEISDDNGLQVALVATLNDEHD